MYDNCSRSKGQRSRSRSKVKGQGRYNITNVAKANQLQLLSLSRDEGLHRHRVNYEACNHDNHDDNDDNELAEDEIDCSSLVSYESEIRCIYV